MNKALIVENGFVEDTPTLGGSRVMEFLKVNPAKTNKHIVVSMKGDPTLSDMYFVIHHNAYISMGLDFIRSQSYNDLRNMSMCIVEMTSGNVVKDVFKCLNTRPVSNVQISATVSNNSTNAKRKKQWEPDKSIDFTKIKIRDTF